MIYLLLEIFNYKQLKIINKDLIEEIDNNIIELCTSKEIILLKKKNGVFLFCLGDEKDLDQKNLIAPCFHLKTILKKKNKDLFGFNLALSLLEQANTEIIENTLGSILINIEEENEIWILKENKEIFEKAVKLEERGNYFKLLEINKSQKKMNIIAYTKQRRRYTIKKVVTALASLKKKLKKPKSFIITGPYGIMKKEIILTALNKLFKTSISNLIPVFTLQQKNRFSLSPLTASINDYILKKIEKYLNPLELKTWKIVKNLFFLLYEKKSLFADHIICDFYLGYNLFFSAYLKVMALKKSPCILICENPEKLSLQTLKALAKLIKDFSKKQRVFPIFITTKLCLPEQLSFLKPNKIEIKPLNFYEIKDCFASLYPGAQVPRAVFHHLKKLTDGKIYPILHYIYYLKRIGKIKESKGKFQWIKKTKKKTKIFKKPLATAWYLINNLKLETKILLYTFSITYNLLTLDELLVFFQSLGEKTEEIKLNIKDLQNLGVLSQQGDLNIRYLKLSRSIRELEPQKCNFIEKRLLEYVKTKIDISLNFVAMQSLEFLLILKDYETLLEILPNLINYNLDRYNFKRTELLLNIKKQININDLSPSQSKTLNCILTAKKLRYLLLRSQYKEAQIIFSQAQSSEYSNPVDSIGADLQLQIARYQLYKKKIEEAIIYVKKAIISFQDLNQTPKISESYIELGQGLLAKGNVYEALEYFGFAEKLALDCHHFICLVKCLLLKAIALFLIGNYSRALLNLEEALKLAASNGLRYLQLLVAFFKARLLFDLGLYNDASHTFQECLCIYRAYNIEDAHPVIQAWLARTYAYMGNNELAIDMLKNQKETQENLFFRAEALFFSHNNNRAIKILTKALHLKQKNHYLFIEQNPWRNGFCRIEESCFEITTYGTELYRLIKALRGYLLCIEAKFDQGIRELHTLTIAEKLSPYDPYAHYFYFLYYLILKKKIKTKIEFTEIADGLTVLNLALKQLQERSTAIDEPKQRINFISKNYWNKELMHEAKLNKLL